MGRVIPQCFTYTQSEASSTWTITHDLGVSRPNYVPLIDVFVNYEGNLTKIDPELVTFESTTVNLYAITGLGTQTPGSGYTNGTFTNVPLLGGSGYGARATFTVSGGMVTGVALTDGGVGYEVGDDLYVANAWFNDKGSGYAQTVTNVSNNAVAQSNEITINFTTPFSGYAVIVQ